MDARNSRNTCHSPVRHFVLSVSEGSTEVFVLQVNKNCPRVWFWSWNSSNQSPPTVSRCCRQINPRHSPSVKLRSNASSATSTPKISFHSWWSKILDDRHRLIFCLLIDWSTRWIISLNSPTKLCRSSLKPSAKINYTNHSFVSCRKIT